MSVARSSALTALASVLCGWVLIAALLLLAISQGEVDAPLDQSAYGPGGVVGQLLVALIASAPILFALQWRQEPLATTGVVRRGLGRSLLVGGAFSLLVVAWRLGVDLRGQPSSALDSGHLWALLQYAVVGIAEEFAFRGYLQTRLVAWLGSWKGWIGASLLMAFAHVVQHLLAGVPVTEAFAACVPLVPISLLLGLIMLRTRNVAGPALLHTFVNWAETLG